MQEPTEVHPSTVEYAAIFDARGREYHEAMLRVPRARDAEFRAAVERAQLTPGLRVADLPSGGGYLQGHLPSEIDYLAVETSRAFFRLAASRVPRAVHVPSLSNTGLAKHSFDRLVSIAGLHHQRERAPIYGEFARLLAPGGLLVIGEVLAGTAVDHFLNGFIDAHGDGHEGWFFRPQERELMTAAGLRVESWERVRYEWCAESPQALADFCRLMFGARRATPERMLSELETALQLRTNARGARLTWELVFVTARKPPLE